MRSYIVFSILIVTACAACLGNHDEIKVSTNTGTELKKGHEIVGVEKLKEALETLKEENNNIVPNVGANTLEAFKTVLNSDELKEESSKTNGSATSKIVETTKSGVAVSKDSKEHAGSHTVNHIHTRQTSQLFGAGSEIIENGGLFGVPSGQVVTTDRLVSNGGLINNGGIIRTDNLVNTGNLLRQGNVVYNQGLSSTGGLLNSGALLNSGRIVETSKQIINPVGGLGSVNLIQSVPLIGSGIQGTNNAIRTNNYQIGSLGGQTIQNSVAGQRRITFGLDELNSVPQTVEYSKQFYHFEAPEEQQESGQITKQLSNVLKKNLQVIFINAPENTAATNAAIQLAKQAIEQRTAIYVLTKEADPNQLVGQLEQIQENIQNAPEVRIIKYRTAEDLERAKLEIQAQYEATGGSTESFNGGVVPVLNYASAKEAYTGLGTTLVPGVISTTHLDNGHNAESSNVVLSVGSAPQVVIGQNTASGKQAFLGSSIGQLNAIKGANTGSVFSTVAPSVYNVNTVVKENSIGTGPLLGRNSGSFQTTTISSPTVSQNIALGKQQQAFLGSSIGQLNAIKGSNTGSVFSTVAPSVYNVNTFEKTNSVGTGPLLGGNSGSFRTTTVSSPSVIASGSNKYFGTGPLITPSLSSGISAGYTRELGSNSIVAPISTVKTSGNSVSDSGVLIDSYNLKGNDGFGSSSLQNSETIYSSSPLVGSSSGISNYVVEDSTKSFGSGSLVGSVKPTIGLDLKNTQTEYNTVSTSAPSQAFISGNNVLGANLGSSGGSSYVVGSGSETGLSGSSTFGSGTGSLQGSNSGSQFSVPKFESGSSNIVGSGSSSGSSFSTGLPVKSNIGSYASKLTIESSKLGSTSDNSASSVPSGVNVLSSTKIDSGSQGSESKKVETSSEYVSGLGIGASIGELVKKEDAYVASSTKRV